MVAAFGILLALLFNRTRGHVVSTMLAHFSFNMGLAVGGAILGSVFIWVLTFIFSSLAIVDLAKLLRGPSAWPNVRGLHPSRNEHLVVIENERD